MYDIVIIPKEKTSNIYNKEVEVGNEKRNCATSQAYAFSMQIQNLMSDGECDFRSASEIAKMNFVGCKLEICFVFADGSVAIFDGSGILIK